MSTDAPVVAAVLQADHPECRELGPGKLPGVRVRRIVRGGA
ncbi:hypothetical protein ACFC1T_03920 [Kitasatospora sp. NPDC056076]